MRHRSDISAKVYLFEDAQNLKAFADVTILSRVGEITLKRFKVISTASGKLWVAKPQFEYEEFFTTAYVDAIVITNRAFKRIQRIVLNEYKRALWKNTHV